MTLALSESLKGPVERTASKFEIEGQTQAMIEL
jgi:hypothetical protein